MGALFSPDSPKSPLFRGGERWIGFPREGLGYLLFRQTYNRGWEGSPHARFHKAYGFRMSFFIFKEIIMVTNIYIVADTSSRNSSNVNKLQQLFTKYERTLSFQKERTCLILIGFNDRAKRLSPHDRLITTGNANLGEGLKFLLSTLAFDRKRRIPCTRSIFLFYLGQNVMQGWQQPLRELFKRKDFAFGLRYVIQHPKADSFAHRAAESLTDSPDRILYYFSPNRLAVVVSTLQRQELAKAPQFASPMQRRYRG